MIKSAFKILVKSYKKNYKSPWKKGEAVSASGSGFAVEIKIAGSVRKFIMTNAHVAKSESFIQVMKWNSDKMYEASLYNCAPEVDMALLEITHKDSKEFWDSVKVFPIGRVPNKGSPVHAVGFPLGGDNSSVTRGIISRVNISTYSRTVQNIALQIDAALNPGNSGGPVFDESGKRIIGIAFAGTGNSVNFMIPPFLIRHYMERISKTKKFTGVCDLMIDYEPIHNKTMQGVFLGNERGVLVTDVAPTGSAGMVLEKHDVITAIDDVSVSNDGTIIVDDQYRPCAKLEDMYEKVPFWHYIRMKHPGEQVEVHFLRDGKKQMKKCTVQPIDDLVLKIDDRISKEVCVIGGFVFLPLNFWHVYSRGKDTEMQSLIKKRNLLPYVHDKYKEFDDQQIVILSETVPNAITTGYDLSFLRLHTVNGEEVKNINHLQQIRESTKGVAKFEFDYNTVALIDMAEAKRSRPDVLEKLGMTED
jgi:S1-C subfamily serine protease